jgi:hypothetical protein
VIAAPGGWPELAVDTEARGNGPGPMLEVFAVVGSFVPSGTRTTIERMSWHGPQDLQSVNEPGGLQEELVQKMSEIKGNMNAFLCEYAHRVQSQEARVKTISTSQLPPMCSHPQTRYKASHACLRMVALPQRLLIDLSKERPGATSDGDVKGPGMRCAPGVHGLLAYSPRPNETVSSTR